VDILHTLRPVGGLKEYLFKIQIDDRGTALINRNC